MRLKDKCPVGLREFGKCAIVFCLSVVVAMGSLLIAAFAPQESIRENLLDSVDGLYLEGQYPVSVSERIKKSGTATGRSTLCWTIPRIWPSFGLLPA